MIERVHDATRINAVLNHASVFPSIATLGVERFDFEPVMSDLVVLMNEHGGFVFEPKGDGVYEVHTQFLPDGRRGSLKAAREAAAYMFDETDCVKVLTQVPESNYGALRLTRLMGFKFQKREGTWTFVDGSTSPIDWFVLTREKWQCRQQRS